MHMTNMVTVLSVVLALTPTVGRADVVLEWNAIMVALVQNQPPPNMNRFAAITQLAVFEAVNAVTGEHTPYLGTVPPAPGTSAEAAAVSAAHTVLRHYFPDRAASLDAAWGKSLAQLPEGPATHRGIALRKTAAAHIICDRPPIERWHSGRVVLLGDAAHPMTPNLGQGAAQAIEDAVVLDECLARATSLADALVRYEQRRVVRANTIVRLSRQFGAIAQWSNPFAVWLRDRAMTLMPASMAVSQARRLMG
jgi:2-polyprenyl-6-methoxyphenol hydroxylase-like FAD-dependent oxidoreductase